MVDLRVCFNLKKKVFVWWWQYRLGIQLKKNFIIKIVHSFSLFNDQNSAILCQKLSIATWDIIAWFKVFMTQQADVVTAGPKQQTTKRLVLTLDSCDRLYKNKLPAIKCQQPSVWGYKSLSACQNKLNHTCQYHSTVNKLCVHVNV